MFGRGKIEEAVQMARQAIEEARSASSRIHGHEDLCAQRWLAAKETWDSVAKTVNRMQWWALGILISILGGLLTTLGVILLHALERVGVL